MGPNVGILQKYALDFAILCTFFVTRCESVDRIELSRKLRVKG